MDPHVCPSTAVTLVTKQCWWVNMDFKFCQWQPPHLQGPTPPGPAHGKALWEGSQCTQEIQGTLDGIPVSAGASEHHQVTIGVPAEIATFGLQLCRTALWNNRQVLKVSTPGVKHLLWWPQLLQRSKVCNFAWPLTITAILHDLHFRSYEQTAQLRLSNLPLSWQISKETRNICLSVCVHRASHLRAVQTSRKKHSFSLGSAHPSRRWQEIIYNALWR